MRKPLLNAPQASTVSPAARILLDFNANPLIKMRNGRNAVHCAVLAEKTDALAVLLEHGYYDEEEDSFHMMLLNPFLAKLTVSQ